MAKENKTHIGFFLNLDKPSDRAINHILETIPSYVSKTSYIKRAIMFYKKHCNDDIEITDSVSAISKDAIEIDMPTQIVRKPKKDNTNKPAKVSPKEETVKELKKEESRVEESSNDLIVSNNSDIDENIDYDELVNGFFQ